MEEVELPCVIEFFKDIWDCKGVNGNLKEAVRDWWRGLTEEQKDEAECHTWEYAEYLLNELWWDELIEDMCIGTYINVGDLLKYKDGFVILASHPEDCGDECWLLNGKLLSTYDLIRKNLSWDGNGDAEFEHD